MGLLKTLAIVSISLPCVITSPVAAQQGNYAEPVRRTPIGPRNYPATPAGNNAALNFIAGRGNPARIGALPRSAAVAPQPRAAQPVAAAKPFSYVPPAPAVSPYLLLDAPASTTGLPVYYTFVKPQLDQIAHNQRMQESYTRLQQQLHPGAAAGMMTDIPQSASAAYQARFMNLGGYYPSMR